LLEGTGQERSVVFVQEIERHEDRPPAAFGGFRPEAAHEQVVAGAAARIADDDLAVEDRALRDRESRELWDQWKQVTAAAVGETKVAAVHRRDGAEAVPLQLEEMIGGVERVCREARPHGCEIPRQRSVRARDLEESWMLAARRARITTHSPSISSGPCLRRFLSRALLARRGLLACERLVATAAFAAARDLALLCLLDGRLERGHEVHDGRFGLRLWRLDDLALLHLGLDDLHERF